MKSREEIEKLISEVKTALKNWEDDFEVEPRLPKLKYNQTRGYLAALFWVLED